MSNSGDSDGFEDVVNFIKDISWSELPPEARRQAKLSTLDTLGAILAGTRTQISEIVSSVAEEVWPGDHSTIFLKGRASEVGAAFANGYTANALDVDDGAKYTRGHPGAQIVPTALALAEYLHKPGKETVAAIVVGYEIASRTGRCWHDSHETYQACGSWGSVACAAVASKLYGLESDEIRQALGIAEYNAPNLPMMQAIEHPAMVKHGMGWGPMTGIIAARLARKGFTGTPSILSSPGYESWVEDIGSRYIMTEDNGVTYKEHASCGWGHPAMEAAHQLINENEIAVDRIEKIWVKGFHETVCLHIDHPSSEEEAQFSVAWPLASLLIYGEVGPDQMLEDSLDDERVKDLVDRIELLESKELNDMTSRTGRGEDRVGRWAASVEVQLEDGRRLDSGITSVDLGSKNEWTVRKIEDKFRWLVEDVIGPSGTRETVEKVEDIDCLSSIRELTKLFAADRSN